MLLVRRGELRCPAALSRFLYVVEILAEFLLVAFLERICDLPVQFIDLLVERSKLLFGIFQVRFEFLAARYPSLQGV